MADSEWLSSSVEETIAIGRQLGGRLRPPVLVYLTGELGAGKTALAKGIVSGLGAAGEEEVTSPTFTLVHAFHNRQTVYHVDLYRVMNFRDLETLGLEDVLAQPAIVLIEWAEKFTLRSDWPVVRIHLDHAGEDRRRIRVEDSDGVLSRAEVRAPRCRRKAADDSSERKERT
ncbi:MAG TPA: tRNA (adenosine(37)-N6)-threonylcarbamoyltransferase complex ATPase subunit type 1 TsaE [Candidatus Acidoferrales bacterium]|nr:tRNA (adenosine(37)-N6)-threonylcarbamoyltransferase complex ATPase subunit type 1 TsaE [Candidatus Acidoferrales bacterium]